LLSREQNGHFQVPSFSANAQRLAALNLSLDHKAQPEAIYIWDLKTNKEVQVIHPGGKITWCSILSPNGEYVISGGQDGITIWQADTGQKLQHLNLPGWEVSALRSSRDGRVILSIQDSTSTIGDTIAILRDAGNLQELAK
jgi:WD40 repeat protein